jgi:DNA-binding transcriptional LysR family regulator
MLSDLNELKTFHQILLSGSMTDAARELGVSLAVVSRRLATLEKRTGVRLINRTTRNQSPTEEGERLLAKVERILEAVAQAEDLLATGRDEPIGMLRISAPVSFGRRHVAPVVGKMIQRFPLLIISLSLNDSLVDVTGGVFDVAVRMGGYSAAGSAAMRKLTDNQRILVASPSYLNEFGRPTSPDELYAHGLIRYSSILEPLRLFAADNRERLVNPPARLRADNGDTVHDWCVSGLGIAFRSQIDVAGDLETGLLERVLPGWHAGDASIVALFPDRITMPLKTRMFIDAMLATFN